MPSWTERPLPEAGTPAALAAQERILEYGVATLDEAGCVAALLGWVDARAAGRYLVCLNPHSIEVSLGDPEFRAALHGADLRIPDGVGMILASRILGGSIRRRVTGSDVFRGLNTALDRRGGVSCFFLGSTEENLAQIQERMAAVYPDVRVAGTFAPPFREQFTPADDAAMVAAVLATRPDVLWVGMTAPKQEKWIHRNRHLLAEVPCVAAVGAVFDFFTGRVRRSHPLFQRLGLEWLPRLLRQPRRLWRRNFVSNPRFLLRVAASRWGRGARDSGCGTEG